MPGENLKSVYVARTVPANQKPFDRLLRDIAKPLGRGAQISNSGSTHLTFLQSEGVKRQFYQYGYTPDTVIDFKTRLQAMLDKRGHGKESKIKFDRDQPLGMFGSLLALMVQEDEKLIDQRGLIESFLVSQFGSLPELKEFKPHITIGNLRRGFVTAEIRNDPEILLPSHAIVPSEITLNGLEVYLGNIHPHNPRQPRSLPAHQAVAQSLGDHHEDMTIRGI